MAYLPTWPVVPVRIKLLYPDAVVPKYMSEDAAGADVCAYLDRSFLYGQISQAVSPLVPNRLPDFRIHMHETFVIPLGFALEIPRGFVALGKGRSGHAKAGTESHVSFLDPDYRGQCCMIVHGGPHGVRIEHGERIGQIAIVPCFRPDGGFQVVDELSATARAEGGFGHTGK